MQSSNPRWQNLFKPKPDRISEITEMWMATPLFDGINQGECRNLVKTMHPRHYKKGETIFNSGDIGSSVVLIRGGSIEIVAADKLLAELVAGDFFGEIALIIDEPRTADAIAVPCAIKSMDRSMIRSCAIAICVANCTAMSVPMPGLIAIILI